MSDPHVTAISLLAFLGAGYTHQAGKYKKHVGDTVKYLKRIQDPEGCFGPRTGPYLVTHACCLLAMAEAYGMTGSPLLRRPVEKGLAFLTKALRPDPSGPGQPTWWSAAKPSDHDALVVGWCIMAMKSIQAGGLEVDPAAFEAARAWLDRMTDPTTGRVGTVQPGTKPVRAPGPGDTRPAASSEALTAMAMLTRSSAARIPKSPDRSSSERIIAWRGFLRGRTPVRSTTRTGTSAPWPCSRWAVPSGASGTRP